MCISVSYINKPIYSPCRGPCGNVKVNKYTLQRCFYFICVSFSFPFFSLYKSALTFRQSAVKSTVSGKKIALKI